MSTNLTVQIRLSRFRRIELETLANTFAQNVTGWVGFHDLRHSLLDEGLHAREPVTVRRPEVVCQIHADHDARR